MSVAFMLITGLLGVRAKVIWGDAVIEPSQAQIITKFCFDFHPDCSDRHCSGHVPGVLEFNVTVRCTEQDCSPSSPPHLLIGMMDDEVFSFPGVAQKSSEITCIEVKRLSKSTHNIDWNLIREGGQHSGKINIVQKVRPRWWYVALASCSGQAVEISYTMHLTNPELGSLSEFSIDTVRVASWVPLLLTVFVALACVQASSVSQWRLSSGRSWIKLHPACRLLSLSTFLAAVGQGCWALHWWTFGVTGVFWQSTEMLARGVTIGSKTSVSLILLLLAKGQVVCTPDIAWRTHRELVCGVLCFGFLCFLLEVWGDSDQRSTTTEYIYDTTAGVLLLLIDGIWLWTYMSTSFQTFQAEPRPKPRRFYTTCAPLFALWFASVPCIALFAKVLAPWVRFHLTFLAGGLAHALVLAGLVYSFQPSVAEGLYEVFADEYKAVRGQEMAQYGWTYDRML